MKRLVVIFSCFFMLLASTFISTLAAENSETSSIEEKGLLKEEPIKKLYVIDGTEKYEGYKILKGYSEEEKFLVYFKGNPESYSVYCEDIRNIDLNEIISWRYNGKIVKIKKKYLYEFFEETAEVSSELDTYNSEWFQKTFGDVYWEWVEGYGFSFEAERLVNKYFVDSGQIVVVDRFALKDLNISDDDIINYTTGGWVSCDDLRNKGVIFKYDGCTNGRSPSFNEYGELTGMVGEAIYEVPDFKPNFVGEKKFSDIRMKIEEDEIYFSLEDLRKKEIIK